MFFQFVRFTFSASGPFIISFGTYSGFLSFVDIFFGWVVTAHETKAVYTGYLLFLYIAGFLLEQKSFDAGVVRNQREDSLATRLKKESRQESAFTSFLSGGYSLIVSWVLERNKITFYDVFKRPSHWEEYDVTHKEYPIFRLQIGEKSLEARFPIAKKGRILIRETITDSHRYGDWREESLWDWKFLAVFTPWEYLKQLVWG